MKVRGAVVAACVGMLLLFLLAPGAYAATDTDSTTVSVTVTANSIDVTAPSPISFGTMGIGQTSERLDNTVNVKANSGYLLEVMGTNFGTNFAVSQLDWKSGAGSYADMSTSYQTVYTASSQPPGPEGDNIDFDLRLTIPSSVSGNYTSTLTFRATNQ